MDYEVLPVFGIDEMLVALPGSFQKIGNDVFETLFTFLRGMPEVFEQAGQFGSKPFESPAFQIPDTVGRMERFCGRLQD